MVALSLGGLRRRIEALMVPDSVDVVLQLGGLAERERHRRQAQAQLSRIAQLDQRTALPDQCCTRRKRTCGPQGGSLGLVESRCGAATLGRAYLLPPLSSGGALVVRPWLRFHTPLIGRVEDWRAGVGRSLCSLLSRPFVCECHTISTIPRFQPPPRRTQRADFLALRSPVCFTSRLMGPILSERLSTSVAEPGSR